ncbi:hypothetical protein JX265_004654 [Neoarthrinium moseri]|uniref:Uncharacterized protein n=1 Tax=Neoarthrinium moseri TaxID=1658444 RepID=A0A9P9WPY3_9PEZI|nr:hypothetical protein JX265_004654 [Neoarthrinium moseri]
MPALPDTTLLTNTLVYRNATTLDLASTNATIADALPVVCAWPVSGQYGLGSRVLYYVLVAACLGFRKVNWLKRACLAAALLLPAVAAIHGIVLASLHTDGAVDMDVYGAFQLCSIGILAAPVTVRLSSTYFNDRGRNIIFVWTGLVLAGLLSLTVEFYRIMPASCAFDSQGNRLYRDNPDAFPYDDEDTTCGLACKVGPGNPWSPMRAWDGSTKDIYVIPAPTVLTSGTATLLAAACCVPAILSLFTMWDKIAVINWKRKFGRSYEDEPDAAIEGTNGATPRQMSNTNEEIMRYVRIAVQLPVFGAGVIAILALGEKNFFSKPVSYQTEPMASIGQWGSMVATGLAALGSLLVGRPEDNGSESGSFTEERKCPHCHHDGPLLHPGATGSPPRGRARRRDSTESFPRVSLHEIGTGLTSMVTGRSHATDAGNRRKFAAALSKVGNYIGQPARKRYDVSDFRSGAALNYPQIPGERARNRSLSRIDREWRSPSVQPSRTGSPSSRYDGDNSSQGPDGESLHSPQTPQSPSSISWPTTPARAYRSYTHPNPSSGGDGKMVRAVRRRDTLEVPSGQPPVNVGPPRQTMSASSVPTIAVPAGEDSPAIVVSSEPNPEPKQISQSPEPSSPPSSAGSSPGYFGAKNKTAAGPAS